MVWNGDGQHRPIQPLIITFFFNVLQFILIIFKTSYAQNTTRKHNINDGEIRM